jgi:hypothetical protein
MNDDDNTNISLDIDDASTAASESSMMSCDARAYSTISADRLITLKDNIEALSRLHQAEVLRICNAGGVIGSENKNGVFINLTNVSESIISAIERYLVYVSTQETQLNEIEMQKKELTTKYFT